ncbi:importin-8-like [Lycorma delicatula]|uniref:importin-8-like n=1 Tax=Lycorma delicatula TaxID=130591 RepID=UPI003F519EA9
MDTFIPLMYRYCYRILNAPTEQHILLQKQILKIHYALVQYALPCQLVPIDVFRQWIEIALAVILQTIPCDSNQGDKNKSVAEQWWNCKKWALRTVHKALVSYGIPDNISKEYYEFSDWYVNTFSYIVIKVLMSILDQFNRNEYVSPRVMELTLDYLNLAVNDVHSWKFLKPHMSYITQQIIYPLLWCTTADIELYYINPHHYIRQKFGNVNFNSV